MITASSVEFQLNLGCYQGVALTEPVAVTRNGRDRRVLLSVDEYHRLEETRPGNSGDSLLNSASLGFGDQRAVIARVGRNAIAVPPSSGEFRGPFTQFAIFSAAAR